MLVEAGDDEVPSDVYEAYKHEEPDQEALVTVSGEVLKYFLPGCETGAY